MIRKLTFIALVLISISGKAQNAIEVKLSSEEKLLYQMLMEYRAEHNLPRIPLSVSLCYVAQTHCKDLVENKPDLAEECNAHSWSDKGNWTACCYTSDHKNAAGMWSKPKQLAGYNSNGYEIAFGSSKPMYSGFAATAQDALDGWKSSSGHNAVIMNTGVWKSYSWNAIGIAIKDGFACVWFGTLTDPRGEVSL